MYVAIALRTYVRTYVAPENFQKLQLATNIVVDIHTLSSDTQ